MTEPTEDLAACPGCASPGIHAEMHRGSTYSPACDLTWPGIYEERDPTRCHICHGSGARLEGFSHGTYECLGCEEVWHIVNGERELGLPDSLPLDDQAGHAWLERLDRRYPPVEPRDLAYALSLSAQLVIAECLDLDEWDEIRCHPGIVDRDGFLLDIAGPSWRALTDALRRRFRHGPTRFSIQERVLLLEGLLRRGALADWVIVENGARHIHPAILEVFAHTPAHELEEGRLAALIRRTAGKEYSCEEE